MKLPDIPYRSGTPSLPSGEAARADNKIVGIRSAQNAFGNVLKTLDREFEQEARLDSMKRFNAARREYSERVSTLTTEFHADTSKPPEAFATALKQARDDIFAKARDGISVRGQKYLNADVDAYNTQASASEIDAVRKLTLSRSAMALQDMATESVALISENASVDMAEAEWAAMEEARAVSPLDAPTKEKLRRADARAFVTTAIEGMLRNERIAEAVAMRDTEMYDLLTPDARASLDSAIAKASVAAQQDLADADANAVVLGQMSMEDAFKRVESRVDVLTALTGEEKDAYTREQKGDVAYNSFLTMVRQGKVTEVEEALATGEYNDLIAPDKMPTLVGAIERAKAAGASSGPPNAIKVRYDMEMDRYIGIVENGGVLTEEQIKYLQGRSQEYLSLWAGDEPPEGALRRVFKLQDAVGRSRVEHLAMLSPTAAIEEFRAAYASGGADITPRDFDTMIRKTITEVRPARLNADAVQAAREYLPEVEVGDMPAEIGGEDWVRWFSTRLTETMPKLESGFQTRDLAGPLDGVEVEQLNQAFEAMSRQTSPSGVNQLVEFSGQLATLVPPDRLEAFFYQLAEDDDAQHGALVARLAAAGRSQAATEVLLGQQALDNDDVSFGEADRNLVINRFNEDFNNAFGDYLTGRYGSEQLVASKYRDAVVAMVAYKMTKRGQRYDADVADLYEEARDQLTGGLLDMHGETFTMPSADVTPTRLQTWMRNQDSTTLGPLYDVNAQQIPTGELDAYWGDRFFFSSAGAPGKYVVKDIYRGNVLRNAEGGPAVITYQPDNTTAAGDVDAEERWRELRRLTFDRPSL